MRLLVPLLVLTVAPALAQTPAALDSHCADAPVPTEPSYEPPPWLGDRPPAHSSAAAAEAAVRRFQQQLLRQRQGPGWVSTLERLASAQRDHCLLSDDDDACRAARFSYQQLSFAALEGTTPPSRPSRVSFRLAMLQLRQGELVEARHTLRHALEELPLGPLRPSALILLGQVHEGLDELAVARRHYARAARAPSPERGLALYLETWAAAKAGDAAAASDLAERALAAANGAVADGLRRDWCRLRGPAAG